MTPAKLKCLSLLLEHGELRAEEMIGHADMRALAADLHGLLDALGEERLVFSRLGHPVAEGVTRPRVYSLTPQGRTTAEALQAELTAAVVASDADRTEQHKP